MKKFLILAVLMATLGLAASPVAAATSVADTTAPTIPTNLVATVMSSNKISLNWNASDDIVAVTGYQIFRNGTQIGTSTLTLYKNTGLTASTIYTYSVKAYDAAGNISGSSNSVSATSFSTPLNSNQINSNQKWQKYYDKKIQQITKNYNQDIKRLEQKRNKALSKTTDSEQINKITEKYNQTVEKATGKYNKDIARLNQKLDSKLNKVNNNSEGNKNEKHDSKNDD